MDKTRLKLRIILITQGLNPIAQFILNNYQVVGVVESAPRKKPNKIKKMLLNYYLKLRGKNLEHFCKKNNIPYMYLTKKNGDYIQRKVKQLKPDLIIVYSMSQLLKKEIIEIPKYGCINLHPSFLPKYRGANPIFWQYFYEEKFFGVTLHFIDDGEDTGDIIYQEEYYVQKGTKLENVVNRYMEIGTSLIQKALNNIDNLPRKKQPKGSPTPRAKNVNDKEYKELILKKTKVVESLFHFICGTENYFNMWLNNSKFYNLYVRNFKKTKHSFEVGKLINHKNVYYFTAQDGLIIFDKKFSLKRIIKGILK